MSLSCIFTRRNYIALKCVHRDDNVCIQSHYRIRKTKRHKPAKRKATTYSSSPSPLLAYRKEPSLLVSSLVAHIAVVFGWVSSCSFATIININKFWHLTAHTITNKKCYFVRISAACHCHIPACSNECVCIFVWTGNYNTFKLANMRLWQS